MYKLIEFKSTHYGVLVMYARDPQVETIRRFETIEDFYEQIDFEPHTQFHNWLMGDGAWSRPNVQRQVAEDMMIILESWLDECDAISKRVVLDAIASFAAQAELMIFELEYDLHAAASYVRPEGLYLVDGKLGYVKATEHGITLSKLLSGDAGDFIPWGDIRYFEPVS